MEFPAPEKSIVAESHQSDDKLIERLVYGWRKIMENITRGYGHHE